MALPPVQRIIYNRSKSGFYGELGQGANAQIKFLQTAISKEELDTITLIENIPGSETWDVRDLFQRDVDKDRVTHAILPYLKNRDQVKFFNPLTLVFLPLDSQGQGVEKSLVHATPKEETENGHTYAVLERPGYYRFRIHQHNPAYSQVQWNDQKVKVVAIDGQHRLSALKRWKDEPGDSSRDLSKWTIPVVLLGIFRAQAGFEAANLLEIVRKTFVYINTRAEEVNEARHILLNDESVNAICAQEIVQQAHSNDIKPIGEREDARTPLIFFDWRGEVQWRKETGSGVRVLRPAAVKTIEEVHSWLEKYLLDTDGSERQQQVLNIQDMVPPLAAFSEGSEGTKLSHTEALRIRQRFRETLFPGLQYLFENFTPYKQYILECRKVEVDAQTESDLAGHAFMKLRFGSHRASQDILAHVEKKYDELVNDLSDLKQRILPELIRLDIGMRGVMYAFATMKDIYQDHHGEGIEWNTYAQWFTEALNAVSEEGWFKSFDDQTKEKSRFLEHVAFDPSGSIVNYKFGDVDNALGTLLVFLIASRGKLGNDTLTAIWDDYVSDLRKPLMRGFRKVHKAELRDFTGTQEELRAEVNRRADKSVAKRLKALQHYLGLS